MNFEDIIEKLGGMKDSNSVNFGRLLRRLEEKEFLRLDSLLIFVVREYRVFANQRPVGQHEALAIGNDSLDAAYPQGVDAAYLDFSPELSDYFAELVLEQMRMTHAEFTIRANLTIMLFECSWQQRLKLVKQAQERNSGHDDFAKSQSYLFVDHLPDILLDYLQVDKMVRDRLPSVLSQN